MLDLAPPLRPECRRRQAGGSHGGDTPGGAAGARARPDPCRAVGGAGAGRPRRRRRQGRAAGRATTPAPGGRRSSKARRQRLDAAYFHACNRGKRSLAVDFAKPEGQEIVRRLAAGADVLIENFKTGGLAKYGLDYAEPRGDQSAPCLLFDHRLRPRRALRASRRLRFHRAGHGRHHGPHRRGGRRAAEAGRRLRRHFHRPLQRHRHSGGAAPARDRPAAAPRSTWPCSTPSSPCSPIRR